MNRYTETGIELAQLSQENAALQGGVKGLRRWVVATAIALMSLCGLAANAQTTEHDSSVSWLLATPMVERPTCTLVQLKQICRKAGLLYIEKFTPSLQGRVTATIQIVGQPYIWRRVNMGFVPCLEIETL
jgi:hypothetical protein